MTVVAEGPLEPVVPCPEDVNGDGVVNVLDLVQVLLCFGDPPTPPCDTPCGIGGAGEVETDINQDSFIDGLDLAALLVAYGNVCP